MKFLRLLLFISLAALAGAQTVQTKTGGRSIPGAYTKVGSQPAGPLFTFNGDLSGNSTTQQVIGIKGNLLPPTLTAGYLHWNGTSWVMDTPSGGGGGTPGGSTTQLQFNNAGVFGGTTGLTWNSGTNVLTSTNPIAGSVTGNSATTTAFGTVPTNCSPNFYPSGISATGNAQNCTAVSSINAATAAAIATNGTTGQVWTQTGTSTQGWQTPAGGGGSGTVGSGTANQIARYAATGTTVTGDSLLTDDGSTLTYSGAGHVTGNFTIDGTLSVAGPWFVNTVWPSSAMGSGTSSTTSNIGISNDGNFYISVGTGAASMICTAANGACPPQVFPSGAGVPNYSGSGVYGTSYSATNKIPATFISTLNQSTTGNAATATALASAPTNCSTGSFTTGIDVSGNAQNCTAPPTGTGFVHITSGVRDAASTTLGTGVTITSGALTTVGQQPYEIGVTVNGLFTSSQVFIRKPTSLAYTIPSGCTNSAVTLGTATTSSLTITLSKNGTSFGTVVIAAGTTGPGTWTCSSSTSFAVGTDVLTITAPSTADTTAANFGGSIYGTR